MTVDREKSSQLGVLQRNGVVCAAFCKGPMTAFIERATQAAAAVTSSPLWSKLPCAATIGAAETRYRATTPEQFLEQIGAWIAFNEADARQLFAFEICAGDDPFNPELGIEVIADRDAVAAGSRVRHLFELRLPIESFAPGDAAAQVELLLHVLQILPVESAYAAPATTWTRRPSVPRPDGRHTAPAFSNRAIDVHVNAATRFEIGGHCRGAYWMVMLNEVLVGAAGGSEMLNELRTAGIAVTSVANGVMLQVGESPYERAELGRSVFARYQALARALEPITLTDDLDLERARFNANPDALDRYERRFGP
jgi:hypothetical protein